MAIHGDPAMERGIGRLTFSHGYRVTIVTGAANEILRFWNLFPSAISQGSIFSAREPCAYQVRLWLILLG
ncbi:hypothetical protein FH972_026782 [Carpinus fangiana]|uniref:Uncharacterized protein n=1 Tax=Carpinus fangiana TaxID=176857 RepID=A0A5N6L516_9ROSI|nr:hypothetical protein FH972_026782 [Carpinus fangiana]